MNSSCRCAYGVKEVQSLSVSHIHDSRPCCKYCMSLTCIHDYLCHNNYLSCTHDNRPVRVKVCILSMYKEETCMDRNINEEFQIYGMANTLCMKNLSH